MEIIIKTPGSGRKWKIAPVDSGLCFGIWKEPVRKKGKNGTPIKAKWLFTERYPTSLPSAINNVVELMAMDPDDPYVIEPETFEDLIEGLKTWHKDMTWEISHKIRLTKAKAEEEAKVAGENKPKTKKVMTDDDKQRNKKKAI